MKIEKKDLKHGIVVVSVENLDDLWHLSQVIEKHDTVRGKTERKIKMGGKEEAVKKTLTLEIVAEDVEFSNDTLRVSGVVANETEDVAKGSHHTLTLEEGNTVTIIKKEWPRYQLKRVEEAVSKRGAVLLLVLDREEALFAVLRTQGFEILTRLKGKVAKKGVESVTENFYAQLAAQLGEYNERISPEKIIVASPAFWKDDFMNEVDTTIGKKVVLATCSSVGVEAIEEILKRPELKEVLRQQRAAQETNAVEELMGEIGRDGLAAYGQKEVEQTVTNGNVKTLLISDGYINRARHRSERLMKAAEAVSGDVIIVHSENEAGKKLDSLGGIGVVQRYKSYA